MAIYHLTTKVFSRGKGQSAIAAAAYRSGERLRDEATGEQKFYTARANRIEFEGLFLPQGSPEWARDRNTFWNRAEQAETRKDGRLAREIEVSLPHELTDEQRLWLVKDFVREAFVRKGYAADVAIHAPDRESDQRNYHAHILISERRLGPEGFAALKDPAMNSKAQLAQWREDWAHLANRHLERHGHAGRIDHRSLDGQGIDREATVHVGYAGMEITQRGGQSDRMDALKEVLARNDERIELRRDLAAIEGELKELTRLQAQEKAAEALAGARALAQGNDAAEAAMTPYDRLRRTAEADERALRGDAEKAFGASARNEASHIRQERLAEESDARQVAWREQVAERGQGQPQPIEQSLRVVDTATGTVSRLSDFVTNLLAGSSRPSPAAGRRPTYSHDPAERTAQRHARIAAQHQARAAERAIERLGEDMEAGRNLKADDIRSLTPQHQAQIALLGDAAVRQMVEVARKRDDSHWRGDERERDW